MHARHPSLCYSSRETRTTTQEPCGCVPPGMESSMRPFTRGRPRHPPFYGWWMVWLGGFLSSLNKTAINKGFPVFVAPVREGFGASNAAVAFIFSLARAQSGPTGLWAGWCLDRWGPRRVLWVGALMSGGGFLALGYTTSLWAFGVLYLLVITVGADLGFSYALSAVIKMTVSQMSLQHTTPSPQQRQHWLSEQAL